MGSYLEIKHHTANIYKYYELPVYEHKDNVEETAKHVKESASSFCKSTKARM